MPGVVTQQAEQAQAQMPYMSPTEYADLQVVFSPEEVQAVRQSWNSMKDDPSSAERTNVHGTASAFFCQQFYENLLGEYPELKVLFPSIKSQASSMAGILSLVISQLENLQRVNDILTSLGKRHSRIIGVEVVHYELVGNALLRTLQDRVGDGFTIDLENAWIKLYSYIANMMLQAGEDPPMPQGSGQQTLYPVLTPSSSFTSGSESRRSAQGVSRPAQGPQPTHNPQAGAGAGAAKGYNPSKSYFKSNGKKKRSKKEDCLVM
jgi:hemoglobin-like flavoprotein